MKQDKILVLDLGSEENDRLVREIRALGVYSALYPHDITLEELRAIPDVKGIIHAHPPILTGFAITGSDLMQRAYLPEPVIEVGPMIMVPYALPLSDELAMQFDACIARSNGFLMESHGCVMVSPDGLKRCLEMMEMMEAQGKSMVVAKIMGGLRSMDSAHVDELEQVLKARNLPMPGLPGAVEKLSDIFVCES